MSNLNPRLATLLALAGAAAPALAQCGNFAVSASTGTIQPGTVDTGNHCDDCTTPVALPFPVTLYSATYTSANVSSNGNVQFVTADGNYTNSCLPNAGLGVAIAPHWDDLRTDEAGGGIFTTITGTAPNRVFHIEWRTTYYGAPGTTNFQLRLFEDNSRFELIYGAIEQLGGGATIGVQHSTGARTEYGCNAAVATNGTRLVFACSNETTPPSGTGAVDPTTVYACGAGDLARFTVTVSPGANPPSTGLTTTANLSRLGGNAAQVFRNDGTNGDQVANDNVYTYQMNVVGGVTPGTVAIPYTVSDAQGRNSSGAIPLIVEGCPSTGPDVFVVNLTDIGYYGQLNGVNAYAIGTDACNMGDVPVQWIQYTPEHPLIAQNMYRYSNGRFEQIGQSWLKHSFQSLNSPGCGLNCQQPPLGGAQLGVGCSDVYGSGYNGGQGGLGPRSEVNPTTGVYPYPFGGASETNLLDKRLQVRVTDIDPDAHPDALFYAEAQYVTADDAQWSNGGPATNGLNNASYQRLSIPDVNATPTLTGFINRRDPAIKAWKDNDPEVALVPVDYIDTTLGAPGIVARFWVAGRATDNGDGTWHYEYAVQNLNSDRCAGRFSVPAGPGVIVSNVDFSGIFAHTREPYPNTIANESAWPGIVSDFQLNWACAPFAPPSGNTSNALRWGTLYNFRFDSNTPPTTGTASLGLFKPGPNGTLEVPGLPVPGTPPCPADYNSDGTVDGDDVILYFSLWDRGHAAADINHDGGVDGDDVIEFFGRWDSGC
jgi:hypothetical protein